MKPAVSEASAGRTTAAPLAITTQGQPQALGALAKLLFRLHQQGRRQGVRVAVRDGVAA